MSEEEPFLARWSRLKRKPEQPEPKGSPGKEAGSDAAKDAASVGPGQAAGKDEEPFDLASLPKIEELTADSDFRRFMDPRVPSELRHAALRRAWTVDPVIRDFIEVAENQYDWNAPDGVPGFGPLNVVGGTIQSVLANAGGPRLSEPEPQRDPVRESPKETGSLSSAEPQEASAVTATPATGPEPAGQMNVTDRQWPAESGDSSDAEPASEQKDNDSLRGGHGRRHGKALPV